MINVQCMRGTSDSTRSDAWLSLWKEANGYNPSDTVHCCVQGCPHRATDGAHVIKEYTGRRQFIVPMCHAHNTTYDVVQKVYDWTNPMAVAQ